MLILVDLQAEKQQRYLSPTEVNLGVRVEFSAWNCGFFIIQYRVCGAILSFITFMLILALVNIESASGVYPTSKNYFIKKL